MVKYMVEKQKIIDVRDILKHPEQSLPDCVFLKDSSVMGWSFDSMATVISMLSQRNYEVKTMQITPKGNLCYTIMQKRD